MDSNKRQTVNPGDRIEPNDSSSGLGLPFLPSLIPLMPATETVLPLDPAGWVQVCQNDPTRWTLVISTPSGIPFTLTTNPDPNNLDLGISCDGSVSMGFKDYGTIVSSAWFVYGRGASANVTVIQTSLRNKRG